MELKNKFLSRNTREKMGEFKQRLFALIRLDISKKKPLKSYFKKSGTIFIHIPKCAGTSVAHALYGNDPWHFSIKEYDEKTVQTYESFAVVRDPVDRFYSSYYYLVSRAHLYPNSIYSDAASCRDANEFFTRFLENKPDEETNYFLRSQHWYVSDGNAEVRVNHLINMNRLDLDFPDSLRQKFCFNEAFPKKNVKKLKSKEERDEELTIKIKKHYRKDYELLKNYL